MDSPHDRNGPVKLRDGTYRVHYQSDDRPSMALVNAIATIRDLDATSMEPLGRTIDMDALDRALQSPKGDVRIQLFLRSYGLRAAIDSGGVIELTPSEVESANSKRGE